MRNSEFHLLVEIDPSGFDREEAPLRIDEKDDSVKQDYNAFDNGEYTTLSNPDIRVMVVYTTNAKNNYSGDINQLITFAVGDMEDAFTTSGVNADINLVHTAEISYNESSNSTLNLCRLTTSLIFTPGGDCNDFSSGQLQGHMNQIHEWRYQHDAHLVVLITGSGGAGIAWTPAITTNYAFSIARYDVAASNYTLAHEVGHNFSAGHDPDNNPNPFYPYAHGYIYPPSAWTTILAYPPSGYSRINRYSTPLKTYAGVPTGTTSLHDNARAMNNRVNIVANFSPPTPPVPIPSTPQISGSVTSGMSHLSWNSIQYATSYKVNRISYHPQVSNTTFTTTNTSYTDGSLPFNVVVDQGIFDNIGYTVQAVNSSGESSPSNMVLFGEQGGGWFSNYQDGSDAIDNSLETVPSVFALHNNYPNPFNPTTNLSFDLPEQAFVSISVYDIMGRKVATLASSTMSAGSHKVSFDASNLSSGIYIARFTATGSTGELFKRDLKMQLIK